MKIYKTLIIIILVSFFLLIISSCYGKNIPSARIDSFSEIKTIQVLVNQSYIDDKILEENK